jgi:hypothetical protein
MTAPVDNEMFVCSSVGEERDLMMMMMMMMTGLGPELKSIVASTRTQMLLLNFSSARYHRHSGIMDARRHTIKRNRDVRSHSDAPNTVSSRGWRCVRFIESASVCVQIAYADDLRQKYMRSWCG